MASNQPKHGTQSDKKRFFDKKFILTIVFIAIVSITFNFISAKDTQDNKYNIISETDRTCQIDISVEQPIFSMNIFELVKHIKRNSKELIIPEKVDINGKEYTVVKITGSTEKKVFESVALPNSLIEIGDHAFYGCSSLQTINIPNSVKSIGDGAFSYCTNLQTVIIPNSVKSIGNGTFYRCSSLQTVIIPNSVESIGNGTFYRCSSLKEIDIPDSVESIGNEAFKDCSSLQTVIIPNSVESIGEKAFEGTPWEKNKQ
ncbi:MAG: leucine-rich repeat domain-containing protein [Paludibacteraceae bacterium]|nr:leucine-rich repeat domain-containing protein [Paludibacteraceae bacterium]